MQLHKKQACNEAVCGKSSGGAQPGRPMPEMSMMIGALMGMLIAGVVCLSGR